jgi:leader peptidase (prepilin peptidase) / N-methyltransferase
VDLLSAIHYYPLLGFALATLLGLLVGSFLNVVIYRLPKMMERDWRTQCEEFLANAAKNSEQPITDKHFNLIVPRSRCPHCDHQIKAWENIPVISYLFLKGKCSACKAPISIRYPLIELITGILSFVVIYFIGVNWSGLAALVFTWALIALTLIDLDTFLLPDDITLPLLWLGLLVNTQGTFASLTSAVIGAATGYLVLWSVYKLFKLLTGKEGMGYGDFKLLAALGAWMGWQYLPQIILLSSFVGALVGISMIVLRGRDKNIPIPFGPYLAVAGWIAFLWGETINRSYLQLFIH